MQLEGTAIQDLYLIHNLKIEDNRGSFIKTYNDSEFNSLGLSFKIREAYYSISKKNVVRGMHFQLPPDDHEKLVYVISGSLIDVVIDLRENSPTFKEHLSFELSSKKDTSLLIPKGCAHGFRALEDETIMVYNVSTEYNAKKDFGIHYKSFGFDWGDIDVITSDRDNNHVCFSDFLKFNPFK